MGTAWISRTSPTVHLCRQGTPYARGTGPIRWDIIARFGNVKIGGRPLPQQFFSDWVKVAEDEAKFVDLLLALNARLNGYCRHFSLLRRRLEELGSFYGEHSVHAGLWESAQDTKDSLSARLCIIHLVHEARGLDVNPTTIAKFRAAADHDSVKVLETIHHDEITVRKSKIHASFSVFVDTLCHF